MPKYRKKPIIIEAREVTPETIHEVAAWCGGRVVSLDGLPLVIRIGTPEGTMFARFGSHVACGVQGEFYPIQADILAATYDRVEESDD